MSNRRIVVLAALALVSLTVASQAGAGQTQPPAAQSYWQNLKQQLTSPSVAVPVKRNQPAAVTSVRG
jgi:curli biogenesis system outer membrane secretion channel CsgG